MAATHDPSALTEHRVVLDHGKGVYADIACYFGVRMNRG